METAGEERVRASNSLKQLEDSSSLLENAAKEGAAHSISPAFPQRISGILNALTALTSRADAERLLASGISMWNSVIAFDCKPGKKDNVEVLVKVRHVAADCIYMAITVLGGISARFDIDDVSLLKFYTACGKKYASELSDIDMAEVCYQKATEFQQNALAPATSSKHSPRALARAVFDLLLGRAECAWERGDHSIAEQLVSDARKHLEQLPEEVEYLASVEYNFGLFMYQAKETTRALDWLIRSFETRQGATEGSMDRERQAKTARLAAVCLLALSKFDEAKRLMEKAETIYHDAVGAYLLLKIAVVTRASNAKTLLSGILEDRESSLDVCMASVALVADAQILTEATDGYKTIFTRFSADITALLTTVGPRYFESLIALGRTAEAIKVLDRCFEIIVRHSNPEANASSERQNPRTSPLEHYCRWSAIALSSGCALADRQDFASATLMLDKALRITNKMQMVKEDPKLDVDSTQRDIVAENEATICRLLASCAISYASGAAKKGSDIPHDDMKENDKDATPDEQALLAAAIANAKRARDMDPDDFSARLLLFRAHLLQDRPDLACAEMQKASADISYFDAGSLAEAACAAQDIGSAHAVLSALKCILEMPSDSLEKALVESSNRPHPGFFGSVLVSFISILIRRNEIDKDSSESPEANDNTSDTFAPSTEVLNDVLSGLQAGLNGIQSLGIDVVFAQDKARREASLKYLADVAWNCGRYVGQRDKHDLWTVFFDICYDLNTYRQDNAEVCKSRRVARIMTAISILENDQKEHQALIQARQRLEDANSLSQALQSCSNSAPDPMNQLLVLLTARCFVALGDDDALAYCVADVCQDQQVSARILEQLAAVCLNQTESVSTVSSESRARRNEMATSLLHSAVDNRLSSKNPDLTDIAVTLRELISAEVSRGELGNQSFKALSRAVGLIKEKGDKYPSDERRWLAAMAWDRAQMLGRTGRKADARRWAQSSIDIASSDTALATYVPRIVIFRDSLVPDSES